MAEEVRLVYCSQAIPNSHISLLKTQARLPRDETEKHSPNHSGIACLNSPFKARNPMEQNQPVPLEKEGLLLYTVNHSSASQSWVCNGGW